jgi:hypothetical protein
MRVPVIALAAAVAGIAGCAHAPPFHPVPPAQAIPGDPRVGTAEAAGVRMSVRPDEWNGWPDDLEDYLTPMAVAIENHSGRALRVRPEMFGLTTSSGYRYEALQPRDVAALARQWGWGARFYGYYSWYPYARPWPVISPYSWWWGPGPYASPPYAVGITPGPTPPGTLRDGGRMTAVIFFPVPAKKLTSFLFDAKLVGSDSVEFGRIEIPFVRGNAPPPPARGAPPPGAPSPAPPRTPPPATPSPSAPSPPPGTPTPPQSPPPSSPPPTTPPAAEPPSGLTPAPPPSGPDEAAPVPEDEDNGSLPPPPPGAGPAPESSPDAPGAEITPAPPSGASTPGSGTPAAPPATPG